MWVRTINGWRFFEVEYTKQGIPYPTKQVTGNSNLYAAEKN
jgi:hypothetical protein